MHPWDTLILLFSMAVCSCDSSNFSFDVECVTSTSAQPCPIDVSLLSCFQIYLYYYKINKN